MNNNNASGGRHPHKMKTNTTTMIEAITYVIIGACLPVLVIGIFIIVNI